jgi:hypothetical protein
VSDRLAIISALEALGAGDQDEACSVLLAALEDGIARARSRCECGAEFEWPGLKDAHRSSGACPVRPDDFVPINKTRRLADAP